MYASGQAPAVEDFSLEVSTSGCGKSTTLRMVAGLEVPNNIIVKGFRVGDGEFQGFDMLLGMDVISFGDFHLTNDGNTVFKFAIPPEENPNNCNLKAALQS